MGCHSTLGSPNVGGNPPGPSSSRYLLDGLGLPGCHDGGDGGGGLHDDPLGVSRVDLLPLDVLQAGLCVTLKPKTQKKTGVWGQRRSREGQGEGDGAASCTENAIVEGETKICPCFQHATEKKR